jgi:hypothetical protein
LGVWKEGAARFFSRGSFPGFVWLGVVLWWMTPRNGLGR